MLPRKVTPSSVTNDISSAAGLGGNDGTENGGLVSKIVRTSRVYTH